MKYAACIAVTFIRLSHSPLVMFCIVECLVVCFLCVCLILQIPYSYRYVYPYCYVYVLLLLCKFLSVYSVLLCCSVYSLCVNVGCTTATGCQPNFS